jgi:hypothetical protein
MIEILPSLYICLKTREDLYPFSLQLSHAMSYVNVQSKPDHINKKIKILISIFGPFGITVKYNLENHKGGLGTWARLCIHHGCNLQLHLQVNWLHLLGCDGQIASRTYLEKQIIFEANEANLAWSHSQRTEERPALLITSPLRLIEDQFSDAADIFVMRCVK